MRTMLVAAAAAVTVVSQVSGQSPAPAAPRMELTFEAGGLVSLSAKDVTVREILREWTRKGGTPFEGIDRLAGGPVTVQFDRRPDTEVLASLLRSASGYVIGPRRDATAGQSSIQVVYVVATSTATTAGYSAPPPVSAAPQMSTAGVPDNEIPPVMPGRGGPPPATPPGIPQGSPPPQGSPLPGPRPAGVNPVAVPIVTVPVMSPSPTPTGTGRGGRGVR
jgi:hypothetical protein